MRASVLPALALAGWMAGLPSLRSVMSESWFPFQPHLPAWAERLLFNPRERSERARDAFQKGDTKGAARKADTALRLAPTEPLAQFNDGTAHLAAGNEKKAIERLEKAVQKAGPALAPAAWYNLGNARLAAGDASGAVAAYRQTLLREPANGAAKFNLELALRKERDRKVPVPGTRPGQFGRDKTSHAPSPGGKQGEGGEQDDGAPKPGEGRPSDQPGRSSPTPAQQGGSGAQRLRDFRDQPDMSASQAEKVLNAVKNFELLQRRQQAAQRARERAATGKDW